MNNSCFYRITEIGARNTEGSLEVILRLIDLYVSFCD